MILLSFLISWMAITCIKLSIFFEYIEILSDSILLNGSVCVAQDCEIIATTDKLFQSRLTATSEFCLVAKVVHVNGNVVLK